MTLDDISMASSGTGVDYTITVHADNNITEELPDRKNTPAAQIYKLQKQIEDTVARCHTIAFMTNDITTLEEALNHCEAVKNTLAKSATTTAVTTGPPIFTAIEKAGVAEFKKERKSQHRVGGKHKRTAKMGHNVKVN